MHVLKPLDLKPTFDILDRTLLDFALTGRFNPNGKFTHDRPLWTWNSNFCFSLPCLLISNQFDHCNGCIIGNSLDDNSWSFMHFIHLLLYSNFDCSLVFERSNQQTRSNSFMFFRRYSNVSWCFTQVRIIIFGQSWFSGYRNFRVINTSVQHSHMQSVKYSSMCRWVKWNCWSKWFLQNNLWAGTRSWLQYRKFSSCLQSI